MRVTTFYLIRHAERDVGSEVMAARGPGVNLTERGRAAAERMAQRLRGERIRHVFSSPLDRARQTAAPIARALGVPVEISPALNEVDFGEWTGKSVDELAPFPRWRSFNAFRSATPLPGGELYAAVQARMVGEIVRLREAYPDDGVALVSHGDPLRIAIGYFIGMPVDFFDRIDIAMASISVLTLDAGRAQLVRMNEVVDG